MYRYVLTALFAFTWPAIASGQPPDAGVIDRATAEVLPQVVTWRRDFHQHPELGMQEVRTSKIIADHLRGLGIEVQTGVAGTGVVGILKGGANPAARFEPRRGGQVRVTGRLVAESLKRDARHVGGRGFLEYFDKHHVGRGKIIGRGRRVARQPFWNLASKQGCCVP